MEFDNEVMPALVLADWRLVAEPTFDHQGALHKALSCTRGKPAIERIIETLRANNRVGDIVIAAQGQLGEHLRSRYKQENGIYFMSPSSSPAGTIQAFLYRLEYGAPAIVTTCDCPLINDTALAAFLAGIRASYYDVVGCVINIDHDRQGKNLVNRVHFRLSDFDIMAGNILWLRAGVSTAFLHFWRCIEHYKGNPIATINECDPLLVIQYCLGRLSLKRLLLAILGKTGARVGIVLLAASVNRIKTSQLTTVKSRASGNPLRAS